MSAPTSVGPRLFPPINPRRRSGSVSNQPLPVRTKPQAPSLSHVINHINKSPKPELQSFLSMDSAITPKASSRMSVAASTTSMYSPPIELPPLRMEGLLGSRERGNGYTESPSSASSYTLTPSLTAGMSALTTPSSASTLRNHDGDGEEPTSPASSVASSVILTPTSNTNSGMWELKSGWRNSVLPLEESDGVEESHQPVDEDQEEEEFLEEIDQWLEYIRRRIRQLEKRHKRLRSSEEGQNNSARLKIGRG